MSTQLSLVNKTEKLKAKDDTPLSLYMLNKIARGKCRELCRKSL
jgi:hypothetical protein